MATQYGIFEDGRLLDGPVRTREIAEHLRSEYHVDGGDIFAVCTDHPDTPAHACSCLVDLDVDELRRCARDRCEGEIERHVAWEIERHSNVPADVVRTAIREWLRTEGAEYDHECDTLKIQIETLQAELEGLCREKRWVSALASAFDDAADRV